VSREPVKLSANGQNLSAHAPRYGSVERIFLGLCIHFPDLTERHRERIATLKLRGDFKSEIHGTTTYDRFLTDVLRVIDEYEGPEQTEFYNLLDPYFMECLDFMHGREDQRRGLLWGHRVIEAFPVLKAAPDEAFMERCFDHFIRLLEFREAEDEVMALSTTPAEQLTDAWAERLFQLKRDIEADRAVLDTTEQELAEAAAGMGRSRSTWPA
jgi:DNA primase